MTPVKQESEVFANDESHFKCVQLHLPVFAMFVSRINFDFCNRVGVNCRSLNEKLFGWITIKIDFLSYVLDSYTRLHLGVNLK